MNTFSKKNGEWAIQIGVGTAEPGQTVTVSLRNGGTKQVTLGERIAEDQYGIYFKAIAAVRPPAQAIGSLSRILVMFDRARQHLKWPSIVLDGIRISVAGDRAREPGSLTITSASKNADGKRTWLGRVTLAGNYEPGRDADPNIGAQLKAFAADPVGVAAEYGRLHGHCCFCSRPLSDERSTAVGYGSTCADHYGLPWGTRPGPTQEQAQCNAPF